MVNLRICNRVVHFAGFALFFVHCARAPGLARPPSPEPVVEEAAEHAIEDAAEHAMEEWMELAAAPAIEAWEEPAAEEATEFTAEEAAEPLITSREFLIRGEQEAPGFGLYSYILIGTPPANDDIREIYLAIMRAYLRITTVEASIASALFDSSGINITYLPIEQRWEPENADPEALAESLLDHYDYIRAQRIILTMYEEQLDGPLIISASVPLSGLRRRPPGIALVQHLPLAAPDWNPGTPDWNPAIAARLADVWVTSFRATASRALFKEDNDLRHFMMEFQKILAATAEAIPPIVDAIDNLTTKIQSWVKILG